MRRSWRNYLKGLCAVLAMWGSAAWSADASEQKIALAANGQSQAVIVTPRQASGEIQRGVKDLVRYVAQSTGATLKVEQSSAEGRVEIHVGQTDYVQSLKLPLQDLGTDGFMIAFPAPNRIVLVGGSDWGSEYAAYEFLERYVGVRWLFPDELGTVVPKNAELALPVAQVVSRPVFISRTTGGNYSVPGKPGYDWLNRMRRHWTIQHHHNFDKLFTPDKYYAEHPEFYPLVNGKRQKPDAEGYSWQPVLDAPGIVDAAVAAIDQYFDKNPAARSYSLGINDNNNFQHPSKYINSVGQDDYSDYYFNFTNQVIEGVLKAHPDKWFGCLAYVGVTDPPRDIKVNPRMVPYICIDRQGWASEEGMRQDMERTEKWHAAAPVLGWYDYVYGGEKYRIPRIYTHLMGKYLRYAAENGVKAYYSEHYGIPSWTEGPKMYVLMKLLWDPSVDVDQLQDEWYRLAVGQKAAEPLAKYYQVWEDYWMNRVPQTDWFKQYVGRVYMDFDQLGYLDELKQEDLDQCRELMKQVVALADTPEHKERAEFFARGFEELLPDVEYQIRLKDKTVAQGEKPTILDDSFTPTSAQAVDTVPLPWGGWQNEPGTARFYWDHRNGYKDSHSLAINTKGAGTSALYYRDFKVNSPEDLYHMGAMVQVNDVNPDAYIGIEIRWNRQDGQAVPRKYTANRFYSAKQFKNGVWTPLNVYSKPPEDTGPLTMSIRLSAVYSKQGIVRFDEVKLGAVREEQLK